MYRNSSSGIHFESNGNFKTRTPCGSKKKFTLCYIPHGRNYKHDMKLQLHNTFYTFFWKCSQFCTHLYCEMPVHINGKQDVPQMPQ